MEDIEYKALKIIKKHGSEIFVSSLIDSDYIVIKRDFHLVNGFYKNRFITEEFSNQVIMREKVYKILNLIEKNKGKNELEKSSKSRINFVEKLLKNINDVYSQKCDNSAFDKNVLNIVEILENKLIINDKNLEDISLSDSELYNFAKFNSDCETIKSNGKKLEEKYLEEYIK